MFRFFTTQRGPSVESAKRDNVLAGLAASERLSHMVLLTF